MRCSDRTVRISLHFDACRPRMLVFQSTRRSYLRLAVVTWNGSTHPRLDTAVLGEAVTCLSLLARPGLLPNAVRVGRGFKAQPRQVRGVGPVMDICSPYSVLKIWD